MRNELRVTFPGGKRVNAEYKDFVIKTDQPVYQGGEGSEPAPFDHFLASIATCSGLYVLAFLQNRGMATEGTALIMRTEKNLETRMIGKISIEIQLPSDFPEKYKNAVVKSVHGCAVTQHMFNPPEFDITVST